MIEAMPSSTGRFLAGLDRIRGTIDRANREVTSGKRVTLPSDDPAALSGILQTHAHRDRLEQIGDNLTRTLSETRVAEQALQSAHSVLMRAVTLASQGTNASLTPASRQSMASEAQGLLDQIVDLTRAQVEGRFVFSGDQDQAAAYALNPAAATGVDRLSTAPGTRRVELPSGVTVVAGRTAGEIFDPRDAADAPAEGNVFAALQGLVDALESGDPDASGAALGQVKTAGERINLQIAFYGRLDTQLRSAAEIGEQQKLRITQRLSDLEDADLVGAITRLNQARTHEQAALAAEARRPRTSLFDFLG